MNCLVVIIIRKKLTGYIKNITEDTLENISSNAIITKDKITYINNDVKHIIHIKNNELILIRETNEFKNILTFSLNRSILSEYVIKKEDLCLEINIKTLELSITDKIVYIKYLILDSNTIYEYKLFLEE